MEKIEYILRNGALSFPKKLIVTPDYIEFQINPGVDNAFTRVSGDQFKDVKYLVAPIQVDMFWVGTRFCIDINFGEDKVLPIRFAQYFWRKRGYENVYSEVSAFIGKHFLTGKVNEVLAIYEAEGLLEMPGLKITKDKIIFENPHREIDLQNVGLKEYYRYFAIYDKNDPNIHRRFDFYEWNAEVLNHTMRTLLKEQQSV